MEEQKDNKRSMKIGVVGSTLVGLTTTMAQRLKRDDDKPQLIIVGDGGEGIEAARLALQARELGVQVVVIDHDEFQTKKLIEDKSEKEAIMSMKSRMGMLALTSLMMGGIEMHGRGMVGGRRYSRNEDDYRKPQEPPKPLRGIKELLEVPKGHKVKTVDLSFNYDKYTFRITAQFSYGTAKSAGKRLNALTKELAEYIQRVPHEELVNRNEFVITLQKPDTDEKQAENPID